MKFVLTKADQVPDPQDLMKVQTQLVAVRGRLATLLHVLDSHNGLWHRTWASTFVITMAWRSSPCGFLTVRAPSILVRLCLQYFVCVCVNCA